MSANDYDVIIIGSGAGGGTLAYRLAPSGLRDPAARARRLRAARARELGSADEVFVKSRYKTNGGRGSTRTAQPFHPGQHYYVGGQTKFYGAILFRLRERDFGEVHHHGGISPAWPLSYADLAPVLRRGRAPLPRARPARRRPDRAAAPARTRTRPSATSRASSALTTTSSAPGCNPFPLPVGVLLDEPDPEKSALRPLLAARRLPVPRRRQGRRARLRVRPALAHPNVTLLTERQGRAARDRRRAAATVTGVVVDRDGARETLPRRHRRRLLRRRQLRRAAAALGERRASGRARATPPASVGRHYMCAHQLGADRDLEASRTRRASRRRSGVNDFYYGADDFELPARAHPDARQDRRPDAPGRRARGLAPRLRARVRRAPRRSTSGSRPRTCREPREPRARRP